MTMDRTYSLPLMSEHLVGAETHPDCVHGKYHLFRRGENKWVEGQGGLEEEETLSEGLRIGGERGCHYPYLIASRIEIQIGVCASLQTSTLQSHHDRFAPLTPLEAKSPTSSLPCPPAFAAT